MCGGGEVCGRENPSGANSGILAFADMHKNLYNTLQEKETPKKNNRAPLRSHGERRSSAVI